MKQPFLREPFHDTYSQEILDYNSFTLRLH
jgi:hypothetical protein